MSKKGKKEEVDEVGDKIHILSYKIKAIETKLANEQEKADKARHR